MSIFLDVLLDQLVHVDPGIVRDTLKGLYILLVTSLQVVYILDKWPLFHNSLGELKIVSIDPCCLLFLGREVQAAYGSSDWTANCRDSSKLLRCARAAMLRLFLLSFKTHKGLRGIVRTYCMNLLKAIEQPFVLAINLIRVLSCLKVDMILSVLVVRCKSLTFEDSTAASGSFTSRRHAALD